MIGRAVIFVILAMFVIAGVITQRINASGKAQTENVISYYQRQSGKNVAQTGVNMALRKLADNTAWRTGFGSAGSPVDLFDGKVYVTLTDMTFFNRPVINITSIGIMASGMSTERKDTSIAYVLKPSHPGSLLAAITTNNEIETLGSLVVDGRDHNMAGDTVYALNGTIGVWTTDTLFQNGSSEVGGTSITPQDFPPTDPGDTSVIRTRQTYPGGYPTTPDGVMGGVASGYPDGTLKSIAMSRIGGSQYTTNPGTLTYPLRGVTYVELPNGGSWSPANINGSGILIVHNVNNNATIKNLNSGIFRGIMIADDIDKIHTTIIGAVVGLSPTPPGGNTIGNGIGSVLFSRQAIYNASTSFLNTPLSGSENTILAWWE